MSGIASSDSTASKRSGDARKLSQRGRARREADRLVAELGEHLLAQAHQRLLVVDEQDGLAVAGRHGLLLGRRRGDRSRCHGR